MHWAFKRLSNLKRQKDNTYLWLSICWSVISFESLRIALGEKSGQIYKHTFNATRTAWVLDFSPTVADPCGQKQTLQVCMKLLSWSGCTVSVMGQNEI